MKNRLEQLRKERGIRQEELAAALEVSRQTIGSLENGRYNPSIILAFKIARYFGLSIEDIFIYEEEFDANGGHYVFDGIVCLVKLEPFEKRVVLPHEETLRQLPRLIRIPKCLNGFDFRHCFYLFFAFISALILRNSASAFSSGR